MAKSKHHTEAVRDLRIDTLYTYKGHYKAADVWRGLHYVLGVTSAIAAFYVGGSLTSEGDIGHKSLIAICGGVSATLLTFLKPLDTYSSHKNAGDSYLVVYKELREAEKTGFTSNTQAKQFLDKMKRKIEKLGKECEQIPHWAYILAKRGINSGEADTSS